MKFLVSWIANALSLWLLDLLFSGIHFADTKALILTALVLVLVNVFLKPVLKLVTVPITCLTLGLFLLVVNAWVLMIAFHFSGIQTLTFGTAFWASIVLSIVNPLILRLFGEKVEN